MSSEKNGWLSTRNKCKIAPKRTILRHRSSQLKPKVTHGALLLTQNSPPPKELFTATNQSTLTAFFKPKALNEVNNEEAQRQHEDSFTETVQTCHLDEGMQNTADTSYLKSESSDSTDTNIAESPFPESKIANETPGSYLAKAIHRDSCRHLKNIDKINSQSNDSEEGQLNAHLFKIEEGHSDENSKQVEEVSRIKSSAHKHYKQFGKVLQDQQLNNLKQSLIMKRPFTYVSSGDDMTEERYSKRQRLKYVDGISYPFNSNDQRTLENGCESYNNDQIIHCKSGHVSERFKGLNHKASSDKEVNVDLNTFSDKGNKSSDERHLFANNIDNTESNNSNEIHAELDVERDMKLNLSADNYNEVYIPGTAINNVENTTLMVNDERPSAMMSPFEPEVQFDTQFTLRNEREYYDEMEEKFEFTQSSEFTLRNERELHDHIDDIYLDTDFTAAQVSNESNDI